MPQILDDAVRSIMKDNPKLSKSSAYAIATKSLQKSGDLKKGTVEATKKGDRRGEMSKATRAKTRAKARKKLGGHSARAMQLATKYYKEMGGKYEGKKSSKNKLSKWGKEDWQTREEYEKSKKK
jgi:hypothetical protein